MERKQLISHFKLFLIILTIRQLRTNVLSFACSRGVPDCLIKAKSYYSTWMQQESNNL